MISQGSLKNYCVYRMATVGDCPLAGCGKTQWRTVSSTLELLDFGPLLDNRLDDGTIQFGPSLHTELVRPGGIPFGQIAFSLPRCNVSQAEQGQGIIGIVRQA